MAAHSIPSIFRPPKLHRHPKFLTSTRMSRPTFLLFECYSPITLSSIRRGKPLCGGGGGGPLSVVRCSAPSPFYGPIDWHGRGNDVSFRSYDVVARGVSAFVKSSALFPVVVAATAVAALVHPSTFAWVPMESYAPAIGGIMLSIGIRLSIHDFTQAFQRPLPLSIGFIAQYMLKPALAVAISRALEMPRIFSAGFILTSCVSMAQLSSYACFLAKGDVALSILLTSTTTVASVISTPVLTGLLIGSAVPVNVFAMSKSIMQVVLVPIALGLTINAYAKPVATSLQPIMPFVAMACTSICIGGPLAINRSSIVSAEGLQLFFPILVFHSMCFALGYWVSKIPFFRLEEDECRTISLCMGMQSSTLAGLLATQFLGSSQAVPPACSVVAMAIMGLCLGSFWGNGHRLRDLPHLIFPEIDS